MSVTLPFGQCHAPVVMIPPAVSDTPRALTEMIPRAATGVVPQVVAEVVPQPITDILPTAVAEVIPAAHVSSTAGVTVPVSQEMELRAPEPQVRLEVIDCDAVVTVSSSLLAEAEPVTQEEILQTMQPTQSERPEVMDRASMFLQQ